LRALLIRQAVVVSVVVLVIGVVLTTLSSGWDNVGQMGWALVFSAGVGAFTLWQGARRVRKSFIDGTNPGFALVPVRRADWPKVDWATIDDYASRLESLGFARLGEFTADKPVPGVRIVAAFLSDPKQTVIVELQQMERLQRTPLLGDDQFAVRVAIGSFVGGRIRVMVTDRPAFAGFYVARSELGVYAAYPGKSVLELLDKQRRLCDFVTERTGKALDAGYNLARYVMLEREKQFEVQARLQNMASWAVVAEFDRFAANPKTSWTADPVRLRSLPVRDWREIDAASVDATATTAAAPTATAGELALRQRMESGASWFYWIAGLSLVNAVSSALGSGWGFVIGLGFTQVLSAIAQVGGTVEEGSGIVIGVAWILNFATIGGFALLGWLARRPSIAAFAIGIAGFAVDTLIFLLAADWVGVAFHGLALFFLWNGLSAARQIKRDATARAAAGVTASA
jgi:hypothetical protein